MPPRMMRRRIFMRRAIVLLSVAVIANKNKVQVTTQDQGSQICDLIKYKDGSQGFVLDGTFYDTNKNIRDPSEVL